MILFFFWKLVQKVQEMIRPGAATLAPNLAGDVQRRTTRGAKNLTRQATRSTAGAGAGVIAAGQRRRMLAADPTRGPVRRTAGTLLAPAALLAGGIRGAAAGPQDAQRRAFKTMTQAQTNAAKSAKAGHQSAPKKAAGAAPEQSGPASTTRVAGTETRALDASRHGGRIVGPVLQRRRPPDPTAAPDPAPAGDGASTDNPPRTADTEAISRPPAPEKSVADKTPREDTKKDWERAVRPAPKTPWSDEDWPVPPPTTDSEPAVRPGPKTPWSDEDWPVPPPTTDPEPATSGNR